MSSRELDLPDPYAPSARVGVNPVAVMLVCVAFLCTLGLVAVFTATAFKSSTFFWKQILGLGLGLGAGFVVSRLKLDYCRRYVWFIGLGIVALLLLVAIPGIGISVNGSRRWLGLGPVRFQVSELAKLGIVVVLAHYLALNQSMMGDLRRGFLMPLAIIGGIAGPIMLQPDFGTTALVGAVGVIVLFLAGARWRYITVSVLGMVALFAVAIALNPNRLTRLTAFLDVEGNKQAGTYQVYQSFLAFASGGIDGAGLGQGRQQIYFLPEAHTDFIFAVVGEELGLIFTLLTVFAFLVFFVCGIIHLRRAPNQFQFLLVSGALLVVALQAVVNLGVVVGRLPTKGMSLPFVSAGMSNLLLMGMIVGLLVNTRRAWTRQDELPGRRDFE
ncbi:MAG: putative lipid II flippase FtsW [Opitutaceae bacterium]|jgi:cell division protein FtsW|nr:putative lipid II flippase FtsW [Opitutaceae bacterium]